MVDFKKLLAECGKVMNPGYQFLQDMKTCHLKKDHDGECKE